MADDKEKPNLTPELKKETGEMIDVKSREQAGKVDREIDTWLKRVEKDPTRMKTVSDINGQPLLTTTAPQKPIIVLPITRAKFIAGFKKTMDEAGRWLSAFVLRLIKRKNGGVKFKEKD